MRTFCAMLLLAAAVAFWPQPLYAQKTCASYPRIVNTPEDKLLLAVDGADTPQEKVAALEKFAQEQPNSNFMPCVNQLLTRSYVQMQQYDKAIAAGEKAVAAGYLDIVFQESLLQAYIAAGQANDAEFQLIAKGPAEIKAETRPSRLASMSDADWAKAQKDAADQAKNESEYMVYAFFRLLPRVNDPQKRIGYLDLFTQAYPDAAQAHAATLDNQYSAAYEALNQADKADDYAEKAVAADPNNLEALNRLAFDYAIQRRTSLDQALADAKKVIAIVPTMTKPNGVSDDQFKAEQNNALGVANLSLGYVLLLRASGGERYATHAQMAEAIKSLTAASELLSANPPLQGGALFYLGNAYEHEYPADHRDALAAFSKAKDISSPWQTEAQQFFAKVRRAVR